MPFRTGISSNKWFYSLKINRNEINTSMRSIITELEKKGIQTRAIWGLVNKQKPYQNETAYKIEKALYYADCILNIPSSTQIKEEDIGYVADNIKQLLKELAYG